MTQPSTNEVTQLLIANHNGSLIGQEIRHYRVVSLIGAGGMGEVYLAEDARLDRKVALKLLPAHLTADKDRLRRFKQEARAVSSLNHPNILTIHEIGEANGRHFLATEFIEGESLRHQLRKSRMEIGRALDVAIQSASALAAAHAKGIVHRDIKPENIMVRDDGYVKVLDFGLAKLTDRGAANSDASTWANTEPGVVVGTVQYMSPEQARGLPVDARTDIWSLGVVLYEAVSGQAPYGGETTSDVIVSILERKPVPLTQHAPEAPAELERIVHKCLQKDRERRYESAEELLGDLKRVKRGIELGGVAATATTIVHPLRKVFTSWRATAAMGLVVALIFVALAYALRFRGSRATAQADISSLAVLPLENLSGDPSQDYFADGMTEALITDLAKLSGFKRVIARTSVMRYKGTRKPPSEIARELRVDALITGAVVRSGDRVRITAQLIDPETENQLWVGRYERDLRDVLMLQNEMTLAIAGEIRLTLAPEERRRLATARTVNPEAHDAYLRGRFHWQKLSRSGIDTAEKYFELALSKDSNYALAYTGIAIVWGLRRHLGMARPSEVIPKGKQAGLKAIELDPTLPEARASLAASKFYTDWDWPAAEAEFQRALELGPNYPELRVWHADFLTYTGRPEEGIAEMRRAWELDPHNAVFQVWFGQQLLSGGRIDEAITNLQQALQTDPNMSLALGTLRIAFERKQMYKEAMDVAKRHLAASGGDSEIAEGYDRGYARGGYQEAMRLRAEIEARRAQSTYVHPTRVATFYASAGEKELALDWLEKAYQERDSQMVYLKFHSAWDTLRDHPRFQDLLRRMKLAS